MHEVLRIDVWEPIVIENKRVELDDLVLQFSLAPSGEVKEKLKVKATEHVKWLERHTGITEYRALAKLFFFPTVKTLPHKK